MLLNAMVDAGLAEDVARERFFAVDRYGLLLEGAADITSAQTPFVKPRAAVSGWQLQQPGKIELLDTVANAKPTVLIGVSGQGGIFNEAVVRAMAQHVERPVIFPLSNPTSRSEATPQQLTEWTGGRAIIGTGTPFPPFVYEGRPARFDQTNNSYIFPGVGLGALAVGARRITDKMFMAAALALAALSPTRTDKNGHLVPPGRELRAVCLEVAHAVARQAQDEGLAEYAGRDDLKARIAAHMWTPAYRPYRKAAG
jgi:malate dehydrogenase (oxaloacetate-decarboxylating)